MTILYRYIKIDRVIVKTTLSLLYIYWQIKIMHAWRVAENKELNNNDVSSGTAEPGVRCRSALVRTDGSQIKFLVSEQGVPGPLGYQILQAYQNCSRNRCPNRIKSNFRGSSFQNFPLGACPCTPLADLRLRCANHASPSQL